MEKALGRELPTSTELRQKMESEQQTPKRVRTTKDAEVDALTQASLAASVMPLKPIDDADDSIENSTPLETIVERVEETHSPSPKDDERNREYLIRRAALGNNPTQEEMRAVVAYGLEQHSIHSPRPY